MLNRRSDYLVLLIATYNRLHQLPKALNSIATGTRCPHEIIVIDGGSTDGTIEYLKSHPGVTPLFQGALLGGARCYNDAWRQIRCKYTCWLSDDTEVVDGSLDLAVRILEDEPEIGMVGLKMKDTLGPARDQPYLGALSEYGVLNCNHGVLSYDLLSAVGYFNESYRSYTIDPDLTASVLCTGKSVVLTKRVSVLHHREWAEHEDVKVRARQAMGGIDNNRVYREKFRFLQAARTVTARLKAGMGQGMERVLFASCPPQTKRLGFTRRDWRNVTQGRFIRLSDPLDNLRRPFHLVQRLPTSVLRLDTNPYRDLVVAQARRADLRPVQDG